MKDYTLDDNEAELVVAEYFRLTGASAHDKVKSLRWGGWSTMAESEELGLEDGVPLARLIAIHPRRPALQCAP